MVAWRDPLYVVDVPELLWRVDQHRQAHDMTWADVSKQTRVHPSVWRRMRDGSPPRPDVLLTLVVWLGIEARHIAIATEESQ